MATLKEIKGTTIQFRDSDPEVYAGSWSSGGALNSGRSLLGGFGSTTGAGGNIVFGGDNPGGPSPSSNYAITESYN